MRCVGSSVGSADPEPTVAGLCADAPESSSHLDFRRFYDNHFDLVCGLIGRFGVESGDIEDLTQQVFLVVHNRLEEIPDLRNHRAWLRAVSVRVVHEYYRWRRVRRVRKWLVEHSWAGRSVAEGTPEGAVLAEEQLEQVRWVLQHMSSKLRDTLVLIELEELRPSEVAHILGIPLNTVRSRRALARIEFRKLWDESSTAERTIQQWAGARAKHDE